MNKAVDEICKHLNKLPLKWLSAVFLISVFSLAIYAGSQFILRSSANDPQLQIATDLSAALSSGENPAQLLPSRSIDPHLSLSPFVMIYDKSHTKTFGNAIVDEDEKFDPPKGVFDYAQAHGQDVITWQPEQGLRIALVVQHYQFDNESGFVMVGRNLREVEKRESQVFMMASMVWIASIATIGALWFITKHKHKH